MLSAPGAHNACGPALWPDDQSRGFFGQVSDRDYEILLFQLLDHAVETERVCAAQV
jgi:hypothetical protein